MQTFAMKSHAKQAFDRPNAPAQTLHHTPAIRSILRSPRLQAKLKIGAVDDLAEREANHVASQVMQQPQREGSASSSLLQRKGGTAADVQGAAGTPAIDNAVGSLGGGTPLPASERAFFEPRFGRSFEDVRVHTGSEADAATRAVNARAFTLGRDIAFADGEYQPGTDSGRALMAHELTHTAQQAGDTNVVQRLIKTPYPWDGVITAPSGANVRNTTSSADPKSIVTSKPKGTMVTVLSSSGDWLEVQTTHKGAALTGYIHEKLVDDAASAAMEKSVGTTMVWKPSGPGSGTDFEAWASAATETPFPAIKATTVMNCWEAVLLSAFKSGALDWNWIHNLYTAVPTADWVKTMSSGARATYAVPGPNLTMPQRGDIVFFDGIAHVALATGDGSKVYTFWPPPNTPFTAGGTTDKVKVFTIEELVTWWTANLPPAPTVEFGTPSW